jgi:hypothetical protein
MIEPKPLASLTSGLLARKGAAQPAMRRQMVGFGRQSAAPSIHQDDLGWNDMGFDAPAPDLAPVALTPMAPSAPDPVVPPVIAEREALAERIGIERAPRQPALAAGRKAAFTLRLDAERHLKLRLAVAVVGRSAQQVVTEALDQFLGGLPEIDRLAQQLPQGKAK